MRVKTFRGDSSAGVLRRIKAELGGDAVILSTRSFKEEGVSVCEITAALEDAAAQPAAKKMTTPPAGREGRAKARPNGNGNGKGNGNGHGSSAEQATREEVVAMVPGVGSWQQEWMKIREHLLTALKPQLPLQSLAPRQRLALEYLEREGLDDAVLADLVGALHGRLDCSVLTPLGAMVPVAPFEFDAPTRRVVALAGPHGVGKTTAAIRLALQARQANPTARIGLVNVDVQRSQGRMMLRQYAELADIQYRELAPGEEAAALREDCGEMDLVLLDLPALTRGETLDQLVRKLGLQALDSAGRDMAGGVEILLVLSPHYAPGQLRQFGRQYVAENVAGLLWTKLDEAYTFGNLVNTAHALGLPAVAFSAGPGMQDDLVPATHRVLWELLFKHRLPGAAGSR